MRLGDGDFDEKEGEKCEYSGLDEADKDLKHHDGHGCHVLEEVNDDEDEDLAGKNVAEEPERERYDACNLTEKLDNPYKKSDDRPEIEEFPAVLHHTYRDYAGNLDNEKRQNRKHKCDVEVGIHTAQKRYEFPLPRAVHAERADAGSKFENVGRKNEKEYRAQEREEPPRPVAALKYLGDVIVDESEDPFEKRLKAARNHGDASSYEHRRHDENRHYEPARDERIGDGQAPQRAQLFRREYDVDAFFHVGGILAPYPLVIHRLLAVATARSPPRNECGTRGMTTTRCGARICVSNHAAIFLAGRSAYSSFSASNTRVGSLTERNVLGVRFASQ